MVQRQGLEGQGLMVRRQGFEGQGLSPRTRTCKLVLGDPQQHCVVRAYSVLDVAVAEIQYVECACLLSVVNIRVCSSRNCNHVDVK